MNPPQRIIETLGRHRQMHLLTGWEALPQDQREALVRQIDELDFDLFRSLLASRKSSGGGDDARLKAARATSPQQLVGLPNGDADDSRHGAAHAAGEQLLREGSVGAILVAGGQGTRLGFDAPKGMFPIGPVSQRTLFQVFFEQLQARARRAGRTIPYFIMTSDATHEATRTFLEQQGYFGVDPEDVYLFQQSSLPAVHDDSDKIVLARPGVISTSPDGHGGMLRALLKQGLLDVMRQRGIEHLYYHQVDNPTAIVCDPAFLGEHLRHGSDMSTKVVRKTGPAERMGVVVSIDGQTQIIEYSDLTPDEAARTDERGNYIYWAGSTAMHVFRRGFLDRLVGQQIDLPFHIAHKAVPCCDASGRSVEPATPNAHKFEQFIFDALPFAERALVVEADRSREFNPVKNRSGVDSPQTSRQALCRLTMEWIVNAGGAVDEGVSVEVSPLYALDAAELATKLPPGRRFVQDTIL